MNIIDFFRNVFTGNWSAAFENIKNIVGNIFEMMVNRVKMPVNVIIGVINGLISGVTSGVNKVIDALNKLEIPVPDWVTEKWGIDDFGFNIKKISTYQIPLLEDGGTVLEGGRVVVGERGAELLDLPAGARVTPLTNGQGQFLGNDKVLEVLNLILIELRQLNEELYEKVLLALINGVKIDWNDRELARLVRKYA